MSAAKARARAPPRRSATMPVAAASGKSAKATECGPNPMPANQSGRPCRV